MNSQSGGTDWIGAAASKGVWTTAVGQVVAIVVQLLSVVVLARLLAPADYGLLAMVLAIVTIGEVIREFGLANAAIQAVELNQQQRTNLFWCNTALGVVCALLLFFGSPLLAEFYHEPRIEALARVLSLTFILGGLTTQSKAHLARDMRFGRLNITDVLPNVLGLFFAIVVALLGGGVWALVVQRLSIGIAMLALAAGFDRWLPGLPRRTPGMRSLLRYGLNLVGTQLISSISRNADYVVMGSRFGAGVTGLYSRAFELVINTLNQINAPSTKVAVPVLSRLQNDEIKFRNYLLRAQRLLLFMIVPILGIGVSLASPLVEIALGPRWSGVVPFVQALALVAATDKILGYATWWFALSKGRTDVALKVTTVRAVLLIIGIIVGSQFGAIGVAWGYGISTTIGWLTDLVMYGTLANAPAWELFMNACRAVVMNAVPVTGVIVFGSWMVEFSAWSHLALGLILYFILWVIIIGSIPRFRAQLWEFSRLVRKLRRGQART